MLYRPVFVDSLALSSLHKYLCQIFIRYLTFPVLGLVQLSQSGQPAVILLRPDVFPHDEENGGTDEAELDSAGEEEGSAALVQIMHHLQRKNF